MIYGLPYQGIIKTPTMPCPQWIIDLANEGKPTQATAQTDTATVIRDLLPQGQERNGEWHLLCPFHDEQNPSFSVNLQEGMYYCFACGAKGNLVKLYAHVKGVTEAAARQALGQTPDYIVELNQKHAVTKVGGKCVILTETYDPVLDRKDIALSNPTDLRLEFANQKAWVGIPLRPKPVVDVWLGHKDRRQYESIVFAPNREVPGYYNLWQGFAVEPKEGDCSLYLEHVKDNIAKGDDKIYDYVLGWMAQCVQEPDNRPGVAIVLRGKQGTGKGVFVTQYGKLFGKHFVPVTNPKHLTGNFNAHLKHALVVLADEAFLAGDKASEGALKAMVTEEQLPIEFKGQDVIYVQNHIHLMVASNHDWVVPTGMEERRFCVLDVGEQHMQDHHYFEKLVDQMEYEGREALLHYLLNYDFSGVNLREFPQTQALLENKLLSMTPVEKFWYGCLQNGRIKKEATYWETSVIKRHLHQEYVEFAKDTGQSRKACETELGMGLSKLVPGLQTKSPRIENKREPCWLFPGLPVCRAYFNQITNGQYEWLDEGK